MPALPCPRVDAQIILGAVLRAVVARKDQQRIPSGPRPFQSLADLPYHPVHLADKIAIPAGFAYAEEFLVRDVTRLVEWAQRQGVDVDVAEAMANVLY